MRTLDVYLIEKLKKLNDELKRTTDSLIVHATDGKLDSIKSAVKVIETIKKEKQELSREICVELDVPIIVTIDKEQLDLYAVEAAFNYSRKQRTTLYEREQLTSAFGYRFRDIKV